MSEWFDEWGNMVREIPEEAVRDCTRPGVDASADVEYWIARLDFAAPPERTRDYLRQFGAWDDEQITDDAANLERLFWIICGDLEERPDEPIYLDS